MKSILGHTSFALLVLFGALSGGASAEVLEAGPAKKYAGFCDAIKAASEGDVIAIFASERIAAPCGWNKPGLIISGVGNPVISSTASSVFEVFGERTVIQNLTIKGARCQDDTCVGVAAHGRDLALRNVRIFGSNVGLKTDDDISGTVWVDSSEFADNDTNIHAGSIDRLLLTNSYLHDATADLVFTKAIANELSGNRFSSLESATTKRQLVLAGSKRSVLSGNVFFKGGKATDTAMIQSADTGEGAGEIQLFNNTLVSHYAPGAIFLEAIGDSAPKVEARRNVIWGNGKVTSLNVQADLSENYAGIDPIFADENFRISEGTVPAGWGAAFDEASFAHSVREAETRQEAPARSIKGQLQAVGDAGPVSFTMNCGPTVTGVLYIFNNKVNLSGPAPTGGVVVKVTSSNPAVAPLVTSSSTIAAGQTSGAFAFRTVATQSATPVTFTATANGRTATSLPIMIGPVSLTGMTLESNIMAGGFKTTMNKAMLSGPAPAEGVTMTLSSNSPAAQVPATIFFPGGFTSQVFPITTSPVTSNVVARITVTHSSGTRTADVTVAPLQINSLVHVSNPVLSGGSYSIIKVVLTGAAPAGGTVISLASSNPTVAPVQSTFTIPAGKVDASFQILTRPVSASTPVTITATALGSSKSTLLTVNPIQMYVLTPMPAVVSSGATSNLNIVLDGLAPAGGSTVTLSSSNNLLAPVPAQVVVPAGVQNTTVLVRAGAVTVPTTVTLTAKGGTVTKTATLTINP